MSESKVTNLIGMNIVGQHGRDIGVVADMSADIETWQLQTLEVKLNRATLDELKLKRPCFGTQTIHVPVGEISGATDNLVLKMPPGKVGVLRRRVGNGRRSRRGVRVGVGACRRPLRFIGVSRVVLDLEP